MKINVKTIFKIVKTATKEWWTKDPFKESAVIAYYAIFSLPGLLVVIITVAGYFFGQDKVIENITGQISSAMGVDTGRQIQEIIIKGIESKTSVWSTILGVFTILLGATGVFVQFQKSLNNIWNVKADETKSGILHLLKARLFSFGLILSIAFILIVSFVFSAILLAFGNWVAQRFSESLLIILQIVNFILSLSILALLFALMFKFFPDAKVKWKHVWIGSFVTALLFEIGKFSLEIYFGARRAAVNFNLTLVLFIRVFMVQNLSTPCRTHLQKMQEEFMHDLVQIKLTPF
ncbi:MAG: YihY/virulence factor BrkB family protein [Saprospiraceae bacterium]|uniref:YihY/virulence factor BrkB family protein n=1 Tax=Candidatus Defluviibacterium haderslevense TaxID=2981993 RepID=A0A9D7SCR1_9BACT|nr:YihY/virulence factor BrkB family protein [Candidatus Defluviibacterium haderslevense]